uniref:C2H2-type domain-containing protein n=1 Tax=Loa loa TaxID=7209 RepID=A0A1I7VG15_LOALO
MSITQIIRFSLLICTTLACNETFSLLDLDTNVITTYVRYPGYEQNVALKYSYHPTARLPNNVFNPSVKKSSSSNENIDYDFFQKYIDNFNLSYFDPDPSEYNTDGEIPEEEQSHKRPHDGCDASFDNRDEYRKRKKTPDQPFICKRKRPDCGPTSSFPSRNETRQLKFQCENCKEFFCRKSYLKIHMKRCLITSNHGTLQNSINIAMQKMKPNCGKVSISFGAVRQHLENIRCRPNCNTSTIRAYTMHEIMCKYQKLRGIFNAAIKTDANL